MFVFTETDRLHHFLYDAFDNPSHPYESGFRDFYQQIDRHIGRIAEALAPEDKLIIHSDHGFCVLEQEVYVNRLLADNGFLSFEKDSPEMITQMEPSKTRAFALDPGRIYIHTQARWGKGRVGYEERETIISELITLFEGLTWEGRKVIQKIYRNEEVFHGPYAEQGPDLVLLANRGFDLKGAVAVEGVFGRRAFAGMHTQDDAFVFLNATEGLVEPFHIEKISTLID